MTSFRTLVPAAFLLAGLMAGPLSAAGQAGLEAILARAAVGSYVRPADAELEEAEDLFVSFLADGPGLADLAAGAGFLVFRPEPGVLVLQEAEGHQRGRGIYASRPGASTGLVVEAPHRFHDRDTGEVARLLFHEGGLRAGAWNTVPRWSGGDGIRGVADSQATTATWFVPFARALVRGVPGVAVVQIHGFAPGARSSEAGRAAGLIVSSGTLTPPSWFRLLDAALTLRFPGQVACFPRSVAELGALHNTTAATLRSAGCDRFVHLEASPAWRERLLEARGPRRRLLEALARFVPGADLAAAGRSAYGLNGKQGADGRLAAPIRDDTPFRAW